MADSVSDKLAALEARRAERKKAIADAVAVQRVADLEALEPFEIEHGDRLSTITIPHTPGLPVLVAVRCPSAPEMKRFRARANGRPSDKRGGDMIAANEELGRSCLLYPTADVFERMCEACPGLLAQAGIEASKLAVGREEDEGKG